MEFLITLLISALMGMGIGGGGLYVIYLTLALGVEQAVAQGTNLLFFAVSGISALCLHLRKRKIYPMQLLILVLFGSLGSIIFSRLGVVIDPEIPKKVLGAVLLFGGGVSVFATLKQIKK